MSAKAIEKGWLAYRRMVVPAEASDVQVRETRQAFYAGAAILFNGIMKSLDPGDEPTEADLQRLTDLQTELDAFGQELDMRYIFGGRTQ